MVDDIKAILRDTLQLGDRADQLTASSPILGTVREFDFMAVLSARPC